MAISNSNSTELTAPASSTYKYTLETSFTETGTDTSANTSTISCSASLGASKIAFSVSDGGTLAVYWHDNNTNTDTLVKSITVSSCGNGGGSNYGTKTASGTITATHKADGTLSGYSKAVFTKNKSNSYIPASGNVSTTNTALTAIPRQATMNSATNFNDEGNPKITYTNSAGNAVSSLQACIALTTSPTNPDIAYRDVSKTGTSYTFNLTTAERNTLRNSIPNANSRNVFFFLKTVINGETYYSYKVATMTIINGNPTIGSIDYSDTNATTTAVTYNNKVIIQNKSTLQFVFGSIASYKGASLTKIAITINGTTTNVSLSGTSVASNTKLIGTINVSSNTNATIEVFDTRGNKRTYTKAITIWEYSNPTAITTLRREANYYSQSYIKVDANYSSLNNHNTITIKYRMKQSNSNSWGNWALLSDNVQTSITCDNNYAWDFQVNLVDVLNTSVTYTLNSALDVGIPLVMYDVKKRSVGINCIPQNSGEFEVYGVKAKDLIRYRDYNQAMTANANSITHLTVDPQTPDGYRCIAHVLRSSASNYVMLQTTTSGDVIAYNPTSSNLDLTVYAEFVYKKI